MEFRFQRFDQHQHNQVFHTPFSSSSTSYNFYSSQVTEMLHRPMDISESIHRELEKERIRSEIIAGELRRRVLEVEARREMFIELREFEPMYGEFYVPENRRVVMSSYPAERSGGYYGGFEAVPFQRRPQSPKFKEIVDFEPPTNGKKEIIGLGNPFLSSGSKRKQSPSPAGSGSTGHCSNSSKKKIREEFSCAACEISTTCERGLNDHIAGKKHQAKMEELKANKKGAHIGLGKVMTGKKFRFWCRLCKIGVDDENIMRSHKKGKKHLKNCLKKEREKTKRARSKSN